MDNRIIIGNKKSYRSRYLLIIALILACVGIPFLIAGFQTGDVMFSIIGALIGIFVLTIAAGIGIIIARGLRVNLKIRVEDKYVKAANFILVNIDREHEWLEEKLIYNYNLQLAESENLIKLIQTEIENYTKSQHFNKDLGRQGKTRMIVGVSIAIIFGGFTISELLLAPDEKYLGIGLFLITFTGIWDFISGLIQWLKNKEVTQSIVYNGISSSAVRSTSHDISSDKAKSITTGFGSPTAIIDVPDSRLILPDKSEIKISTKEMTFGRNEIEKAISSAELTYVSRQHFKIKLDAGKYYILDNNSTNGTKVNGIDIRGNGWQELKSQDRIGIADAITVLFKNDVSI